MHFQISASGFEKRNIVLSISFLGKITLFVDTVPVKPVNGVYSVKDNNDNPVPLRLKRRFPDPAPVVELGTHRIILQPPFTWRDYIGIALSPALVFVVSVIGSFVIRGGYWMIVFGIIAAMLVLFFTSNLSRTRFPALVKHIIAGFIAVLCIFALVIGRVMISVGIDTTQYQMQISDYQEKLHSSQLHEIHAKKHEPRLGRGILSDSVITDTHGYPTMHADALRLREMLRSEQYQQLNEVLQSRQQLFEKDFRFEELMFETYRAFAVNDPSLIPFLNSWTLSMPDSYQPFLARGVYKNKMGWESRGYKWASETSSANFTGMGEYFAQAEQDLFKALSIEPQIMIAYETLMDISRARGDQAVVNLIMEAGLKVCPYTFRLRERYMYSILPRWGGSYEQMQSFAIESGKFSHYNTKLHLLKGYLLWDAARMIELDSNWSDAVRLYTNALSYGEHALFYEDRGNAYVYLEKYDSAIADFDRGLELSPYNGNTLVSKCRALYLMGQLTLSSTLLDSAVVLDPTVKGNVRDWKRYGARKLVQNGYELAEKKRYQDALALYNQAISYYPDDAPGYYYRGWVYIKLEQWNDAIDDMKKAITNDPRNLDYYLALDNLLAPRGQWSSIIEYWTMLISMEPENARAYLERGGAYFHKGDLDAAKNDAQKACELGSQEACAQLKKLWPDEN